jgi:hypothetical protein
MRRLKNKPLINSRVMVMKIRKKKMGQLRVRLCLIKEMVLRLILIIGHRP